MMVVEFVGGPLCGEHLETDGRMEYRVALPQAAADMWDPPPVYRPPRERVGYYELRSRYPWPPCMVWVGER